MRPDLPRGQPPAPGILHLEPRARAFYTVDADGKPKLRVDPAGYWLGQHTNPGKKPKRRLLRRYGRRQLLIMVKRSRREGRSRG